VATSFWSLSSHAFAVRIDKKKHEINSKPSSPQLSPTRAHVMLLTTSFLTRNRGFSRVIWPTRS